MSAAETSKTLRRLGDHAFALPALLLFAHGALSHIGVPGLYFDAINPDYLALRLFTLEKTVPYFGMPGQLLFGKLPILIQIYHGALPFYLGLPAYFVFGTDVVGVRIANFCFGALVLAGLAMVLRAFRIRAWVAGAAMAALALDPGFVLAFRTQFYITTLPIALVFASIALLERDSQAPSPRATFLAGALAGLSVYGYFIYAFLLPAVALHAYARRPALGDLWPWAMGVALGISPYALGLILMVLATGGPAGMAHYLADYFHGLAISKPMSLGQRAQFGVEMFQWTVMGVGPRYMITGVSDNYDFAIKGAVLFGAPLAALALGFVGPCRFAASVFVLGALLGLFALALVFADRTWLHHYAPELPLLYFALAVAMDGMLAFASRSRLGLIAPLLGFLPILLVGFGDGVDLQHAMIGIERTGGVGLFSEGFLRFADDAAHDAAPARIFLPDWGMMIPFAMQTGGTISMSGDANSTYARKTLCQGRDAVLAVNVEPRAKRIDDWSAALGAPPSEIKTYSQRDGVAVMVSARWRAADFMRNGCRP